MTPPEKPSANRPPSSLSSQKLRTRRYEAVLDFLSSQKFFHIDDAHSSIDEPKSFITRLVKILENEGWLIRESNGNVFSWNKAREGFSPKRWAESKIAARQVTAMPSETRPREKMIERGVESLTVAELFAILIRSGRPGESAIDAGMKLARHFDGRLEKIIGVNPNELKSISSAINITAFCQIVAGVELGRRVAERVDNALPSESLNSTAAAMRYCERRFARLASDAKQEEFHIVSLDTKNKVIATHRITVGTLDASLVHPREVFRAAIRDAASSIILCHNHPSGDPAPSREDFQVTRRLEQCGETLGIRILDHIIVASRGSSSIRESEMM